MRRVSVAVPAMISALVAVGAAAGSGGTSIASAPVVQPGVQLSGDTSTDATANGSIGSEESTGCWNDVEYRRLPLTAGAQVLIKGTAVSPASLRDRALPGRHDGSEHRQGDRRRECVSAARPDSFRGALLRNVRAADRTNLLQRDGRAYTFVVTVRHKA